MKNTAIIRSILVAAAFGAVLSAQAQVGIELASAGTLTAAPDGNDYGLEPVVNQVGGYGVLSSFTYVVGNTSFNGTGVYSGAGGTLDIAFSYVPANQLLVDTSAVVDGTWNATGGTGTYAGAVGNGTIALILLGNGQTSVLPSETTMSGTVASTPEPAPLAVMALGGVGVLIRRRKRA